MLDPSPDSARAEYLALDSSIRMRISEHEWRWMTDDQRAGLERAELEPDH